MTTAYLPSRDVPRRTDPGEPAESADLRRTLRVLMRHRVVILAATVLGGTAALVATLVSPRSYAADASVLVSRSKIGENQATETLSTANFRPLVENREVASQVIKTHHLDAAPYFASPTNFFGDIVTIDEVRNSTILMISGRLNDPTLVANVVNDVATLGIETARRVSQDEALQARNDIKVQLDEAKKRLDTAESDLQKARATYQVELVKKDVDSALLQRGTYLELTILIAAEKARLATAESELKKHQLVDTVHKTIDTDPALLEAARSAQPGSSVLGMQLKSEEVSTVYQEIDKLVAGSRTKLAGLERQRSEMVARNLDRPELKQLSELYTKEIALSRLEMERDLSKKVYEQVAVSYESARLLVAGRSSALHLISTAVPPDKPESRKLARALLIGLMSGLLLSAVLVILRDAYLQDGRAGRAAAHP